MWNENTVEGAGLVTQVSRSLYSQGGSADSQIGAEVWARRREDRQASPTRPTSPERSGHDLSRSSTFWSPCFVFLREKWGLGLV